MKRIVLLWSFLYVLLGLLCVFPAQHYYLWQFRILTLEWGYWFILVGLIPFIFTFNWTKINKWALGVFFLSSCVILSPLIQAFFVADEIKSSVHPFFKKKNFKGPFQLLTLFSGYSFQKKAEVRASPYKTTDRTELRLDYYYKGVERKKPCVLVVHGGGWDSGDARQLQDLNYYLSETGYAVAALNYKLAPEYTYPSPVEDVRDALRYLSKNADRLGIDTNSYALLGRSAGGQIALMAAYTHVHPGIKAVISFYAPTDMAWGYSLPCNPNVLDSRNLMWKYLGNSPALQPELYFKSSPVNFVNKESQPTLIFHGKNDELVDFEHSTRLKEKLDSAKVPNYLVSFPWATHGFDYCFNGPASQITNFAVSSFLYHCFFRQVDMPEKTSEVEFNNP